MKKLLAIILAAAMAMCLTACASPSGGNAEAPEEQIETPKDPTPSAPSSPDPTPSAPSEPSAPDDTTDPDESDTPDDTTDPDPSDDPTEPDPVLPPEEPFSLAENREKIIGNIMPLINYYKMVRKGNKATVDKVYDISIDHDNTTTKINAVFSGIANSEKDYYLEYGSISMPLQSRLTFRDICETSIPYEPLKLKFSSYYTSSMLIEYKTKYADTIEKIQRKLFDNYDNALWLGWSGTNLMQSDKHTVVYYGFNTSKKLYVIQQTTITIPNDGATLNFPNGAVDKYLMKNQYTIHDNYNGEEASFVITLPDDTLNALIEKELQEKEQTQGQEQEQAQTPISKETLLPPPAQDRLYASLSHKRAIK